ncbi:sigma-70 family RNA polymerase sigma factor, partial [Streptomyces sp. NPDC005899]
MTLPDHDSRPADTVRGAAVRALRPLVRAEATAEAAAAGMEAADLEQAVWVRLLERPARQGPLRDPARWVRAA